MIFDIDVSCVEPQKRLVAGKFAWAVHRFPIVGGRTFRETVWRENRDAMMQNICRNNALLSRLKSDESKTS